MTRTLLIAFGAVTALAAGTPPTVVRQLTIYQEPGRFAGWPANHGIWQWANELLVGFSDAYFEPQPPDRHQYDRSRPEQPRLARSLDGGDTWTIEAPPSLLPPEQGGAAVSDLPAPMNFRDPGFAMTIRYTDTNSGPSRLWYSLDRGRTWRGPYAFPMLGQTGILGRTDYLVNGSRDALVFLTASKSNGKEGRVFAARTHDGGLHWNFLAWIGAEPAGFSIMPSSVRLSRRVILTATRVKQDEHHNWIDLYRSGDGGAHWRLMARPVPDTGEHSGNPPQLLRLTDGRLCITYGYRSPPYSIRAVLSADLGRNWSPPFTLRSGAAAWDLGYTRSAQRPDGNIVTVYYFNHEPHTERFLAATIWNPGEK
jgi:hypothetical protein